MHPKSFHTKSRKLDEYLPSKRPTAQQKWKRKTMYIKFEELQLSKERKLVKKDQITNGCWVTFIKDYKPKEVKDELRVSKDAVGIVNHIKGENAYVKLHGSFSRGYVPLSYCRKLSESRSYDYLYTSTTENLSDVDSDVTIPSISNRHSYFSKRLCGPRLLVLYDFEGEAEDDLFVKRGEFVRLLNADDEEWLWVKNDKNEEGFVPKNFLNEHICEDCRRNLFKRRPSSLCSESGSSILQSSFSESSESRDKSKIKDDVRNSIKSSSLLIRCNYRARKPEELSVHCGDIVKANLKDQIAKEAGWIWVYSPARRRSGYIPENSVETLHETKI